LYDLLKGHIMCHGLYLAYRRLSYCWHCSAGIWPKVQFIRKLC